MTSKSFNHVVTLPGEGRQGRAMRETDPPQR